MTNGRENRKPWQQKRLQRRRPRRRRNTSSSSSLTGGRASVPFFFALCCRSVTPVVFTSRLSLGQCGALAFCRASQIKPCTRLAEEFWPGELFDHRLRASSGALARAITKRPCKQG